MEPRANETPKKSTEITTSGLSDDLSIVLDHESIEYLASIADISASMRPFEEVLTEAAGCPDPAMYAGDEGWEY